MKARKFSHIPLLAGLAVGLLALWAGTTVVVKSNETVPF
jgi:hypothetical protein